MWAPWRDGRGVPGQYGGIPSRDRSHTGSVPTHLTYLTKHAALPCFAGAYATDKPITQGVINLLTTVVPAGGNSTPEGRYQVIQVNNLLDQVVAFEDHFAGYFSKCG